MGLRGSGSLSDKRSILRLLRQQLRETTARIAKCEDDPNIPDWVLSHLGVDQLDLAARITCLTRHNHAK